MQGLKTLLFYLSGLIGLVIISLLLTNQNSPIGIRPLPTATPLPVTPTPKPSATATPAVANRSDCTPTPGGFAYGYTPKSPFTVILAPPDLAGERLIISGAVYAADCLTPLPGALIEVWQADAKGEYDRSAPFILRGRMRADNKGRYEYQTIRPGHYAANSDRVSPAHIHYQVSYADNKPWGTMLYFADDPYLRPSTNPALVTELTEQAGPGGPVLHGVFDIILEVAPPTPTPALPADSDEYLHTKTP